MAYRMTTIATVVADDSELGRKYYDGKAQVYQTLDQKVVTKVVRVGTGDAEAAVDITPITSGKCIQVLSDYPIKLRLNGAAETQFVGIGQGVKVTNQGSPVPDKCIFYLTCNVTSVRLAPITSATQTANVTVIVTGDPISDYTGG